MPSLLGPKGSAASGSSHTHSILSDGIEGDQVVVNQGCDGVGQNAFKQITDLDLGGRSTYGSQERTG